MVQSYIFGGNTGVDYDELKRRRALQDALMQQVSEGSEYTGLGGAAEQLGKALLYRTREGKVAKGEKSAREDAKRARERLIEMLSGGGAAESRPEYGDGIGGDAMRALAATPDAQGQTAMANPEFANSYAPSGVIQSESGGRWDARNNEVGSSGKRGHFGRIQWGHDRFADAKRAGVVPQDMTIEEFATEKNAPVQKRAERWHWNDIRQHISDKGYDQQGWDTEGLMRVAHLGGKRGMDRYVASGGQYNPEDANETSLNDYYSMSGGKSAPTSGGPRTVSIAMSILDNPYASEGDRVMAGQVLQQAMAQPERMTPYQRAQLSLKEREMKMRGAGNWSPGTNVNVNNYPEGGAEYRQPVTPGQKKVDEEYADTLIAWQQGGQSDFLKQMSQLEEVVTAMESGENLTGPGIGTVSKIPLVGSLLAPSAVDAREQVEEVVQRNLRLILGAQFAQREGELLISRAYNPLLPEGDNVKRVRRLMESMEQAAEVKQSQADYFFENGTLTGWEGPSMEELRDEFRNMFTEDDEEGSSEPHTPAELRYMGID